VGPSLGEVALGVSEVASGPVDEEPGGHFQVLYSPTDPPVDASVRHDDHLVALTRLELNRTQGITQRFPADCRHDHA